MQISQHLRSQLKSHVYHLAGDIGERNGRVYKGLQEADRYLVTTFTEMGYEPFRQTFDVNGKEFANIEVVTRSPSKKGTLVIGAHYDSVTGCPGANDNATGVAALLALAKHFVSLNTEYEIRFVAFVNEEPPYFQTRDMGSLRYAEALKSQNVSLIGMISLETIGYYSKRPGSQKYPGALAQLYPDTGHFISFVSNEASSTWLDRFSKAYGESKSSTPFEKGLFPEDLPGVGWSDHWAFWKQGYSALMVTDTAPFRYPHYHTPDDTPDKVDYENLTAVTQGLMVALSQLAKASPVVSKGSP